MCISTAVSISSQVNHSTLLHKFLLPYSFLSLSSLPPSLSLSLTLFIWQSPNTAQVKGKWHRVRISLARHTLQSAGKEGLVTSRTTSCSGGMQ